MLLGIETATTYETLGIKEGTKAIREAGFDAADITFYFGAATKLCGDDYRERAEEIRDALFENGLVCHQAHAPFDFRYGMEESDDCFEYLSIKRSIEAAAIIGADHIVVHGVQVPQGVESEESISYNRRFYKGLEPLCEKFGIRIAVENLSAAFTYPHLLNRILKELDSPWFVGLVDVGHAWLRANMQPGAFIRQLDPGVLKGLHIQDNHGTERGMDEHLVPYMATIDFEDLMVALREVGYEGDFTLEVIGFLRKYAPKGLLVPALHFAEQAGRSLSDSF